MKLTDRQGNCPGCHRAARLCRDGKPCEYRRAYHRLFTSASPKPPYRLSERAVPDDLMPRA